MQTNEQFAYAALYSFHRQWMAARRAIYAKRPRKNVRGAMTLLAAMSSLGR